MILCNSLLFCKVDITYSDRTQREAGGSLSTLVSDYVDLARELIKIAKDHGAKDEVINNLLNSNTMNHGLAMKKYLGNIQIFL